MERSKWVTASVSLGWVGLTEGKDYKVLSIKKVYGISGKESEVYTVVGDNGTKINVNSSFFDEPKSLPQRSTPCEEVGCGSFDDLVYIPPPLGDTRHHYVLEKVGCSQEQWQFLLSSLPAKRRLCGDNKYLAVSRRFAWIDTDYYSASVDVKVSFNDLFKYMGDV